MSQPAASSGPVNAGGFTTAAVRSRPSLISPVGVQVVADTGHAVASKLNASAVTNARFISHPPVATRAEVCACSVRLSTSSRGAREHQGYTNEHPDRDEHPVEQEVRSLIAGIGCRTCGGDRRTAGRGGRRWRRRRGRGRGGRKRGRGGGAGAGRRRR